MAANPIRVTVWNEYRHEKSHKAVADIYPKGIHGAIAEGLTAALGTQVSVRTATLDEPEHGLTDKVLAETDVLTWWGHMAHGDVKDSIVDRVQRRVLEGMGLIVLHSGHHSKIFRRLMGTTCNLKWREAGEMERLWCVSPGHPIAEGLGEYIEIPHDEMYGELFDIPTPDDLVFIGWFEGGNVFRSGACWTRGKGHVFYFQPGHETFPVFFDDQVRKVLANAVRFVAPRVGSPYDVANCPNPIVPLNPISNYHAVDPSLHTPEGAKPEKGRKAGAGAHR